MARKKDTKRKRRSCSDKADRKANRPRSGGFNYIDIPEGFEAFKPDRAGKKTLSIVPYEVTLEGNPEAGPGDLYYERTFFIHKIDIGGDNSTNIICPLKTIGNPCPVCEYREQLSRDINADKAEVKSLYPKERQLFNITDRSDPDTKYIWDISVHLFGKLLDQRIASRDEQDDEHWHRLADMEGGYDLKVLLEEKKYGSFKYYETKSIDFKLREDLEDEDVDSAADLDSLLIVKSYKEISGMMVGEEAGELREPKKKKNPKTKTEPVTYDVEEDADELDEEDGVTRNEAPKKEKKKKKKKEKCPAGYKFGKDCDKHDECDGCDKWKECDDAQKEEDR